MSILRFPPIFLACLWLSLPSFAVPIEPPPYIYQWDRAQSKNHIDDLQKKFGKLSDAELASARQRAEEAKKNQDYALEVAERERIVGKSPGDLSALLALCLARVQLIKSEDNNSWSEKYNLEREAIHASLQSTSPEERIRALLFLAASNPTHSGRNAQILADIAAVMPLASLREKFPELADVFPFSYTGFHFDEGTAAPSVCLTFNHLIAEDIQGKDFIQLTPAVDGAVTLKENALCIRGLAHGKTYTFLVKKGLKSQFGELLTKESTAEIYIPDDEARITFPNHGYVLRKGEQNLLPVSTINVTQLKVDVRRLSDRAIASVSRSLLSEPTYYHEDKQQSVYSGTYEVIPSQEEKKHRNETIITNIDLNAVLKDIKPGIYAITAAPEGNSIQSNANSARQWLLVTDMGLTTYKGAHGLDVDVRSLAKAIPFEDVQIQLISQSNEILSTQTTDKHGFAHFPAALLQGKKGNEPVLVLAYNPQQKDFSLLYLTEPAFDLSDRGVSGRTVAGPLDVYLYTDRGVYRGGETVHLNALLRDAQNIKAVAELPLTFKVTRPDGVVITQELRKGDAQGHYALDIPLLPQTRIGHWTITAHTDPEKEPLSRVAFQVEDFMPARLVVRLKAAEEIWDPVKALDIVVEARYLFGAIAANLSGKAATHFTKHPNPFADWKGFSFGRREEDFIEKRLDIAFSSLDAQGFAPIKAEMDAEIKTSHPLLATIVATIIDPSGRQQLSSLKRLVLLQPQVIGIRPTFAESGLNFAEKDVVFEVISVDRNGKLQGDDNLEYELFQEEIHYSWFKPKNGYGPWEYRPVSQDHSLEKGKVKTSAEAPARLSVPLKDWGNHRLSIHNPKTGASTSVRFAKGYSSSPEREHSPHRLSVIADKASYKAGDKVKLHITSPFDGLARLTVANQGVIETQTLSVNRDKGIDVTLTASETWGSGAYVIMSAFRPLADDTATAKDKEGKDNLSALMPKRAIGLTWVGIDRSDRILTVSLEVPEEVKPKQKLTVPLLVKGSSAKDIQVTVAAVDEGILQLTDYKTPAPQDYFFEKTELGVEIRDLYGRIIDPMAGRTGTLRSGGDESMLSKNLAALTKRSFKIVSLYAGRITLDAEGKGSVTLDIPEFNGQLRFMAVAFDNEHVGSHDARILVRDPVVIETGLPRFLNLQDQVTLPISLHNVSVDKGELTVTVETTGAVALSNPRENQFKITVERGKDHLLSVPCRAETVGDGTVRIQVEGADGLKLEQTQDISVQAAESNDYQSQMTLLKPGETFALDPKKFAAFYPERFKAELTFYADVPWNLQSLITDLNDYSYGCIEQLTSRGFGLMALANLHPEKKETQTKAIEQILKRFAEQQNPDGFFNLWSSEHSGRYSWLTAYAFHFMQVARAKEIPFSPTTYKNSEQWLKRHVETLGKDPNTGQLFTAAYAIYLLSKEEKIQASDIRYFFDIFYKKLPNKFAKGFILATLARMGDEERFTAAMDQLDAEGAPAETTLFFGTEIRNEAGLLALLLEAGQSMAAYPKLQERLATQVSTLSARVRLTGRLSTNEQAWLVIAAEQLLTNSAKTKGFTFVFDGQEITAQKMHQVSLSPEQQTKALEIKNTAAQPLWMSLTMLGTPREALSATSNGITLKRTLYTLKGDVADTKALKSGDSFVVVVEGEVNDPLVDAHLLVVDRLSAGLEIDNPSLNPSQPDAKATLPWLEGLSLLSYREMRDDRFITSFTLNGAKTKFKVAYIVRATLPGTYTLPALTAEDMFAPSRHARTALGTVTVVA